MVFRFNICSCRFSVRLPSCSEWASVTGILIEDHLFDAPSDRNTINSCQALVGFYCEYHKLLVGN